MNVSFNNPNRTEQSTVERPVAQAQEEVEAAILTSTVLVASHHVDRANADCFSTRVWYLDALASTFALLKAVDSLLSNFKNSRTLDALLSSFAHSRGSKIPCVELRHRNAEDVHNGVRTA